MKKKHDAGPMPEGSVQPEDPIEVSQNLDEVLEQVLETEDLDGTQIESDDLKKQLEDRDRELQETTQKYLRLAAEYDNFRKRTQKEKEALYADSVTMVVKEWLPILDNLDRAAQLVEQTQSQDAIKIAEGLTMVRKQACDVMERLGVSEIDCLNAEFDPNLHDAVMHIEDDNYGPSTVAEVLQKGYMRGETVIRHSIVKVAN
ncbi:MAG: nucleotide exchange factor GrpE [Clostridiaceae bacterium]|nr:nucleotide exchange factor GrpE [Clostridiaceae bacterium]